MDADEKIALFKNMAEADPTNELAHFSLGKLYFEKREPLEAEKSLRRTLELSPEHAQAHRFLGEVLLELGKKDQAVEVLTAGIELAHRRGEYMPRNQMRDLLAAQGVEPPELLEAGEQERTGEEEGPGAAEGKAWQCSRCLKPNPRLDEPPFTNELGNRIHECICRSCWQEWVGMSIKVINEYRLNLASPEASEIFDNHMKEFLGL